MVSRTLGYIPNNKCVSLLLSKVSQTQIVLVTQMQDGIKCDRGTQTFSHAWCQGVRKITVDLMEGRNSEFVRLEGALWQAYLVHGNIFGVENLLSDQMEAASFHLFHIDNFGTTSKVDLYFWYLVRKKKNFIIRIRAVTIDWIMYYHLTILPHSGLPRSFDRFRCFVTHLTNDLCRFQNHQLVNCIHL